MRPQQRPERVGGYLMAAMAMPMPEEQAAGADVENAPDDALQQARLDGVRLASRTLEHTITNSLTLTIGYAELLAEDPDLPPRLREMARLVYESAQDCARAIRRLREVQTLDL